MVNREESLVAEWDSAIREATAKMLLCQWYSEGKSSQVLEDVQDLADRSRDAFDLYSARMGDRAEGEMTTDGEMERRRVSSFPLGPLFPPILAEDVRRRIAQLEVEKGPGVEIEPLTDTERRRLVEGEWITDGEMDDGEG